MSAVVSPNTPTLPPQQPSPPAQPTPASHPLLPFHYRPLPTGAVRFIGALLLIGGILILAGNEHRATLPVLSRGALPVNANSPFPIDTVRFVAATGVLTSSEMIGDDPHLPPGPFAAVQRIVEMYAWKEDGTTYTKEWTNTPQDSLEFAQPTGHQNPPKLLASRMFLSDAAKVGVYDVNLHAMHLPPFRPLQLGTGTVLAAGRILRADGIYSGTGTPEQPNVGDTRIRYAVLPHGDTMTLYGGVNGRLLEPYLHPNGAVSYDLFHGTIVDARRVLRSRDDGLQWPMRILGFLIILFGFFVLLPLSIIRKRWPDLATINRWLWLLPLVPLAVALTAIIVVELQTLFATSIALAIGLGVVLVVLLVEYRLHHPAPPSAPLAPSTPPPAPPSPLPAAPAPTSNLPSVASIQAPISSPAPLQPAPPQTARKRVKKSASTKATGNTRTKSTKKSA